MSKQLTVLVVDDDQRMVKTICDILQVKGYRTLAAYSGEEAIEMLAAQKIDCVFTDVKMPGIDGIETLIMIKSIAPKLPVVLMSANVSEKQVALAKRHGALTVLTKPIDMRQILSLLSLLRKDHAILVVDDDPHFCRTLEDILATLGYQVQTEVDAGNVMKSLESARPIVVILDYKLGRVNGLEVFKTIRDKHPAVPVVLVTGHREDLNGSLEGCFDIGTYTCLYKPLEMEELMEMIEGICMKKMRDVFESA